MKLPTAAARQGTTFAITDTKIYVPVVTLWTQDNTKLLQQQESGFKITNSLSKYQSNVSREALDSHLDFQINPNFQRVNRFLLFENNADRTSYNQHFPPTVEIKDYIVMIDGKRFFNETTKKW